MSQYKTDHLQQVVDIIVKSVAPEKIYLLGVCFIRQYEEIIFLPGGASHCLDRVTNYYLSVITRSDDKRSTDELQDMIEGRCKCHATPVTVYIDPKHVFDEWLATGNYFAYKVNKQGLLLYEAGDNTGTETPVTEKEPDEQLTNNCDEKEITRSNNTIAEFLAGTELYRLRKQFSLAAFLLHQAAEQAFTLIIQLITGYRAVTHNLDKLLRYTKPLSVKIAALYQLVSEKENKNFRLLQQAYIHSRYRNDYSIKETELCFLLRQVKQLQQIAAEIAEERVAASG